MLATFLILTVLESAGVPPEPLHPRDYASPSGEWVLSIDPSERHGAGPAHYRMARSGARAWEREHAFTFQDAFVSDAGLVVGYAYSTGLPIEGGEFVVAALDHGGEAVHVERTALVSDEDFRRPPHPRVRGMAVYPDLERIVLELSVPFLPLHARWRVRSLEDGAPLGESVNRPDHPEGERWSPPEREPAPPPEIVERRCVVLGAVELERPAVPEVALSFRLLDGFGRAWCVDRKGSAIHAFDRDGRWLFAAQPAPADLGRRGASRVPRWIAVRPDGSLLVRWVEGLVEFTPHGERVGRTGEKSYRLDTQLHLQGSGGRWEVDSREDRILRVGADGTLFSAIRRGSNGRWLRNLRDLVIGGDGRLAVLETSYGSAVASSGDAWVHAYDRTGEALSSQRVPDQSFHLAFDGRRVALTNEGRVLFGDALGEEPLGALGWTAPADVHGLAFAPEGELLVFAGETVHRLLVP